MKWSLCVLYFELRWCVRKVEHHSYDTSLCVMNIVVEMVCLNFQVWVGEWRWWWVFRSQQWECLAASTGGFPLHQPAQRGGDSIRAVLSTAIPCSFWLISIIIWFDTNDFWASHPGLHINGWVCGLCCLKIDLALHTNTVNCHMVCSVLVISNLFLVVVYSAVKPWF